MNRIGIIGASLLFILVLIGSIQEKVSLSTERVLAPQVVESFFEEDIAIWVGGVVTTDRWGQEQVVMASGHRSAFTLLSNRLGLLKTWHVLAEELRLPGAASYKIQVKDVAIGSNGFIYGTGYRSNSILKFSREGTFLAEFGRSGSGDGELLLPTGIYYDHKTNEVYVADSKNHRIQVFSKAGDYLRKWGRQSEEGAVGVEAGEFNTPIDVFGHDGIIYVSDQGNHRVQAFTRNGQFLSMWGRDKGYGGMGDLPGEFDSPNHLTVDNKGRIYVADTNNSRIQVFSPSGKVIANIKGEGVFRPHGLCIGDDGSIYYTDALRPDVERVFGAKTQPTEGVRKLPPLDQSMKFSSS